MPTYGTVNADKLATSDGYSLGAGNSSSMKNRIINGACVIDQRNAGASVSISTGASTYTVDRWSASASGGGVFTAQRTTVVPTGFTNSYGLTVTTVDSSIASNDYYIFEQQIEGFNCSDLGFGTANASTVTLSFWVRSSLTGLASGRLCNNALNRSYVFTFTVNAANTWEYKTVTIAGDTSGTWLTDNGRGMSVTFNLASGSSLTTSTIGSWVAGNFHGASTQTLNFIGTNGATFYITGVQLEVGSTATSFDYRPYGTELQLCQRYYEKSYAIGTAPGTNTNLGKSYGGSMTQGLSTTTGYIVGTSQFKVSKRATATVTLYDLAGTSGKITVDTVGVGSSNNQASIVEHASENGFQTTRDTGGTAGNAIAWQFVASAEL